MKKINGNLFLWIPIILIIIYKLSITFPTTMLWIMGFYICFNIIGLISFGANYKGYYNKTDHEFYYWDLDNYTSFPKGMLTKELIDPKNEHRLTDYEISNLIMPFHYFRLLSISCWILYFIMLTNRWFNKNLTIEL